VKFNEVKTEEPKIILGLYKEHFFIEEPIKVSKWWIDNYNEHKDK
jgi:hypothetical protein